MRNARVAAGYGTLAAWAAELGISERTLGNLERGHGAGPNTISAVENSLGWEPGSAERIARGGEPIYIERQLRYSDTERQEVWDELGDYFNDEERAAIVEEVIRRRRGGGNAETGT